MGRNDFEIIARAVILCEGKILLCQSKKKKYYFFPGGHIEFGEKAAFALKREIKEELGVSLKKSLFIGVAENIFENRGVHHEINLVFKARFDKLVFRSRESHINFVWFDIAELSKKNILPVTLKKAVLKWIKDKKIFWINNDFKAK